MGPPTAMGGLDFRSAASRLPYAETRTGRVRLLPKLRPNARNRLFLRMWPICTIQQPRDSLAFSLDPHDYGARPCRKLIAKEQVVWCHGRQIGIYSCRLHLESVKVSQSTLLSLQQLAIPPTVN